MEYLLENIRFAGDDAGIRLCEIELADLRVAAAANQRAAQKLGPKRVPGLACEHTNILVY